ncbi:hypothetical protein MBLNU13_g04805t1 [Cladosporium sp. NU13]
MMDINLPKATSASIALFFAILAMLTAPGCVISIQSSIAVGYLPHSSMLTSYVAAPCASIGYQHSPTFSPVTATLEFAESQATIFSPAPNQSVVPPGSTQQIPSDAYGLLPTYNPVLGEHLPLELRELVNEYRIANFNLLRLLLEHGLVDSEIATPYGLDEFDVEYRIVNDNGMPATIPYILGGQHMRLYNSIRGQYSANSGELARIRRELLHWVEIAIAGRATVHDWHLRLPANDPRVANNPRHAAFLDMLIRLRDRL